MGTRVAALWAGRDKFGGRGLAGPLGAMAPELILSFDAVLSRVVIDASGLGGAATYAVIDRSLDGVRWTTVRGAAELTLVGQALPDTWYDYEFALGTVTYRVRSYSAGGGLDLTVTGSIATSLDGVWLKSPQRPFLNTAVSLGGRDFEVDRASRGSVNDVLDRTLPIAVGQPQGSRRYPLILRTETDAAGQQIEYLLASGDVLFLHAPANKVVPAGGVYIRVDGSRMRTLHVAGEQKRTMIPVTEVAAPGPDVAYALSTWATVLALYATWDDLLAANATWDDLLQLIGDPAEVIVD